MAEWLRLGSRPIPLLLLLCWTLMGTGAAAEKVSGILSVRDALTLPNRSVRIEAHLAGKNSAAGALWSGVALQLQIDGRPVATAKTTEGGRASFEYLPKMRGMYVITVSVDDTAPVSAEKAQATLCVWERRRPILLVEMDALMQPGSPASAPPVSSAAGTKGLSAQPAPDAANELSLLTRYYYNVVYVSGGDHSKSEPASIGDERRWLALHEFPTGLVVMPPPGGLSATIETFTEDGWTTLKTGIGRTRLFAEILLQHRMEVVVIPELPKGELPRKAKAAKAWNEVRKKL